MTVVVRPFFGQIPINPSRRIALATVLRLIVSPSARRSAKILGAPKTSSDSPWNHATFCSIRSR